MSTIKIKEDSLFAKLAARKLKTGRVAMVLGRTIHLHNTTREEFLSDKRWLKHELKHIEQFQRYGFLNFVVRYLWESVRKGYRANKFEVEARNAEND